MALDNRLERKAGDMRKAKGDVDVSMVERIFASFNCDVQKKGIGGGRRELEEALDFSPLALVPDNFGE